VTQRCCIPADLLCEEGTIRLNEPPDSDHGSLLALLLAGTYRKPFVIDDGTVRRLYFNLSYVQSEMTIDRPYALNFAYTRKMMGFLLFMPRPKHVVIVGLGGGSLTRFCHRHLPRTRVTTVEIDSEVIAFADLFQLPKQDARCALIQANAVDYFATTEDRADVVLLDGCDEHGIAPDFCDEPFYQKVRACLKEHGLLVMNLVGSSATCAASLAAMAHVFGGDLIVQKVGDGSTKVAFAFKDPTFIPDWANVHRHARELAVRRELALPELARKLQKSAAALRR
jgi:spermidine synthase